MVVSGDLKLLYARGIKYKTLSTMSTGFRVYFLYIKLFQIQFNL